jgi:ABC-2 type transport system permease protein
MNMQTKASIKKELLAYSRTKKLLIVALVFFGWSIFSPLMIRGLGWLMDSLSPMYDEIGMDVSGMTEMFGTSASIGVTAAISDLSGACLIVLLLLINSNAGGEQKKRSIIIPRSSGLRSFSYIFPKFIVYPPIAFVFAIAGALCSWGISSLVFDYNDVTLAGVLVGGVLAGVSLMFYICAHLTIGTATGQAGMSAAICIVASLLLPNIFTLASLEYMYNPFTLNIVASAAVQPGTLSTVPPIDIVISALIAVGIMVVLYFIALFAQNARRIDNSGNEIKL